MKHYNQITKETSKMVVAKAEADKAARDAAMAKMLGETVDVEVDVDECASCDATVAIATVEVDKKEPSIGVTTTRLNIRETPSVTTGNVVAVINEGTVVMIDSSVANGEWLKVYTESGIEGYCMSQFVKVNN